MRGFKMTVFRITTVSVDVTISNVFLFLEILVLTHLGIA